MTVAVCIPTIPGRECLLTEALASVDEQVHPASEVIVELDETGTGAPATRNRAWRRATSDVIAFLDDDDLFYPNHLKLCLAALTDDVDLVYPWFDGFTADTAHLYDGTLVEGQSFSQAHRNQILNARSAIIPVTVVVRRSALERVGGFPEDEFPEDPALWKRLLWTGSDFRHVPERTWHWRDHDDRTAGRPWTQPWRLGMPRNW